MDGTELAVRGTFEGTWQTTGSGLRVRHVAGLVLALLLLGSGAAAIAAAVLVMLIAVGAVVLLAVAGLAAWLVYRARRGNTTPRRVLVQPYAVHQLGAPERPALEQPRELHLHFHGTDPEGAAEILRRCQQPE
jgi:hypothetical protein